MPLFDMYSRLCNKALNCGKETGVENNKVGHHITISTPIYLHWWVQWPHIIMVNPILLVLVGIGR